jgi:predicted DNA-binding ArsR family transcriptional regulator
VKKGASQYSILGVAAVAIRTEKLKIESTKIEVTWNARNPTGVAAVAIRTEKLKIESTKIEVTWNARNQQRCH